MNASYRDIDYGNGDVVTLISDNLKFKFVLIYKLTDSRLTVVRNVF